MEMNVQVLVLGARQNVYDMEGNKKDVVEIAYASEYDQTEGKAHGFTAQFMDYKTSDSIDEFKGVSFPTLMNLRFALVTKGRKTIQQLKSFEVANKQPAQAAKG